MPFTQKSWQSTPLDELYSCLQHQWGWFLTLNGRNWVQIFWFESEMGYTFVLSVTMVWHWIFFFKLYLENSSLAVEYGRENPILMEAILVPRVFVPSAQA